MAIKYLVCALSLFVMVSISPDAMAKGNRICSGSKGGISHCQGNKFVCNDGSISQSKQMCKASNYSTKKSGKDCLTVYGTNDKGDIVELPKPKHCK